MANNSDNRLYLRSNSSFLQSNSSQAEVRVDHKMSPLQNREIKSLLEKVDMNSALLNLAAKDEELI